MRERGRERKKRERESEREKEERERESESSEYVAWFGWVGFYDILARVGFFNT